MHHIENRVYRSRHGQLQLEHVIVDARADFEVQVLIGLGSRLLGDPLARECRRVLLRHLSHDADEVGNRTINLHSKSLVHLLHEPLISTDAQASQHVVRKLYAFVDCTLIAVVAPYFCGLLWIQGIDATPGLSASGTPISVGSRGTNGRTQARFVKLMPTGPCLDNKVSWIDPRVTGHEVLLAETTLRVAEVVIDLVDVVLVEVLMGREIAVIG